MAVQILLHTPHWVFPLFFVLLALGLWMRRERTTTFARAAAFPLAMLLVSALGVVASFGGSAAALGGWLAGVALMTVTGAQGPIPPGARHDPHSGRITLPGSWRPLALMMAIFFFKYLVGVMLALRLPLTEAAGFDAAVSAAYGSLSACFLWPLLRLWRSRTREPAG